MLRKLINVYVVVEGDKLRLRTIEMQYLDKSTPVTALTRANTLNFHDEIELVVEAIYRQELDMLQLLQPILEGRDVPLLAYFNQLPGDREQNRDLLRAQLIAIQNRRMFWMNWLPYTYKKVHRMSEEMNLTLRHLFDSLRYEVQDARDSHHPDQEYAYHDLSVNLPMDGDKLLRIIGALDSFIHTIEVIAKTQGYQLFVNFCNDQSYQLDRNQIVADSAMKVTAATQSTSRIFARFIAERIIEEVSKNPQALHGYVEASTMLKEIVKTETPYLCRVIQEKLYPKLSIKQFLLINAPFDGLMLTLLDPSTHFLAATRYLMDWLLKQFALANGKDNVKTEFNSLKRVKDDFWRHTVDSLFGLLAPDGGYYSETYTEIVLMRESALRINKDGLLELDIYQSKSYKEYYQAKEAPNHDVLEEEVRAAFRHLGLEFLSGLDFHRKIIFTRASSIALMNQGVHYSENYAKSLARASHYFRLFTSIEKQRTDLPELPSEIKNRILSFVEPELHEGELQQMRVRKLV